MQLKPEEQFSDENRKWDDLSEAQLAEIDKNLGWFPPNEEGSLSNARVSENVINQWQPQNEFPTSTSSSSSTSSQEQFSPGYAAPDFSETGLKEIWIKLTNEEQQQILALPNEKQEEAMKNLLITRENLPVVPNYGSNGELNAYFARLTRPEQIKLLLMSLDDQKKRLEEMARNSSPSDDFSKLRIITPENKTSAEKLYGSPELKMLAPTENISPKEDSNKKQGSDVNEDSNSNSNTSNKSDDSNIKRVTF
jgi:hypothetical protein